MKPVLIDLFQPELEQSDVLQYSFLYRVNGSIISSFPLDVMI